VVVEDVLLDGTIEGDAVTCLRNLARAGSAVFVTTRTKLVTHRLPRDFNFVGPHELLMTLEEALAYAAMEYGSQCGAEGVAAAWEACGGHPALVAMSLRQRLMSGPRLHGVGANAIEQWVTDAQSQLRTSTDRTVLIAAALVGEGCSNDLRAITGVVAESSLDRIAEVFPFVTVETSSNLIGCSDSRFAIPTEYRQVLANVLERLCPDELKPLLSVTSELLVSNGEHGRALEVVALGGDECSFLRHLDNHGHEILASRLPREIDARLRRCRLTNLMQYPSVLLLWADALRDTDRLEDSLAKARAVHTIAAHAGDRGLALRAQAICVDVLRQLNRWVEAAEAASEIQPPTGRRTVEEDQALLACAKLLVATGDYTHARALLESIMAAQVEPSLIRYDAESISAMLPAVTDGDFVASVARLTLCTNNPTRSAVQLLAAKGNLATSLLEMGRLSRAKPVIVQVLETGVDVSIAHFLPVLGCVEFAEGQEHEGLSSMAEGIRKALASGAEAEGAQSRVYEAMLLRAGGRVEDSLTSAERAYERLCVQDFMDFRRLAALEVAASLLALGDASATRAWAEPVVEDGFGENLHHAFRAAMILALCDQAEGNEQDAVFRLAEHASHLRSGNSNFQAAMYARAFPNLLGLMATTFGVGALPIHLLRMVPSKNAERSLRACREYLDPVDWQALGARLLGESQFTAFVERDGRPICHVRLFGGLSLSVGDRTVLDREWKKRKARMLFAMLVTRRGQEVAREQIFDLLWPELPSDRAKNNFYVAWSAMKAALMGQTSAPGGCPYVDNSSARCRIVPETVRSDLDEFEETLRAARDADVAGNAALAIESYERIAAVYHGDLMESDPYEDWVVPLRDRYRFEFIGAMLRVAQLLLDRDDPCRALLHVRRAIQIDRQREDLYQAALRCHIAAGQRSAAVETFINCRTQLSEELGLDPSAETIALYQQILVMEDRPRIDDYGLT